jgi:hypothetical protein
MSSRTVLTAAVCALALGGAGAGSALAAGNDQRGFTVGDCISDVVYGNEPNMADGSAGGPAEQDPGTKGGNVLPSQSPGPFVNDPNDPDNPARGRSVGQFHQDGIDIPALCRAAVAAG